MLTKPYGKVFLEALPNAKRFVDGVEMPPDLMAKLEDPDVEDAFNRAREHLQRDMGHVEEVLGEHDPTLRAAADSALGRALHQVDTLHEKAVRALKKRDQTRADCLRRTRDALLPGGLLQERGLGLIGLLARHGLGIVDVIRDRMDPWAKGHQVIYL